MKSINAKLLVSAVAVAMLATPALAATRKQDPVQRPLYNTVQPGQSGQSGQVETYIYPNGAARTGTAANVESGATFNLQAQPNIY